MVRKLIIHIGTHKTGTTSIQHFIRCQSETLAREGILVPRSGTIGANSGHHNIAWELLGDDRFTPGHGCLASLIAELKSNHAPLAVISSEAFEYASRFQNKLRDFEACLNNAGISTEYVAYVRNKEDYIESLYVELIKHGLHMSIAEMRQTVQRYGSLIFNETWYFEFDIERLNRTWSALVGSFTMLSFDDAVRGVGLIPSFLALVGGSAHLKGLSHHFPRMNTRSLDERV